MKSSALIISLFFHLLSLTTFAYTKGNYSDKGVIKTIQSGSSANSASEDSIVTIDLLYKQIYRNPNADEIRFNLIEELISLGKFREAGNNLYYLTPNYENTFRYKNLESKIKQNFTRLNIPTHADSVVDKKVGQLINRNLEANDFSNAQQILQNLNKNYPNHPDILQYIILADRDKQKKKAALLAASVKPKIKEPVSKASYIKSSSGFKILPVGYYFSDNIDFQYFYGGSAFEFSFNDRIGIGIEFFKGFIKDELNRLIHSRYKGLIFVKPLKLMLVNFGLGEVKFGKNNNQPVINASIKYGIGKDYKFKLFYKRDDASIIFLSRDLVKPRLMGNYGRLEGEYNFPGKVKLFGKYEFYQTGSSLLNINGIDKSFPENVGNSVSLILYKQFSRITASYEFFYSDFKFTLPLYYSPQDFKSQSIRLDYWAIRTKKASLMFSAKLGYLMTEDFASKEFRSQFIYWIYERLKIDILAQIILTKRYRESYNSSDFQIRAFWNFN